MTVGKKFSYRYQDTKDLLKSKIRILCFGEAMVELSSLDLKKKTTRIGFAGDTLNTAIYLKRVLAEGAQVDYLTVLGQDLFSDHLKKYIESELVGTHLIRRIDSRNVGLYAININPLGEREFSYWRDRSAARLLFHSEQDFLWFNDYAKTNTTIKCSYHFFIAYSF